MDEMEERAPAPPEEDAINFAEERLRLEREALAVERERLAAARAHAEAEASLMQRRPRPILAYVSVLLLVLLAGTSGFFGGMAVMEYRLKREREESIAKALSHINDTVSPDSTNTPSAVDRNSRWNRVSLILIQ